MKTFKIKLTFVGLTGEYSSTIEVRAKTSESALKKARLHVGNRDCVSIQIEGVK